jgi:type IV secretory pathway VirB4 component
MAVKKHKSMRHIFIFDNIWKMATSVLLVLGIYLNAKTDSYINPEAEISASTCNITYGKNIIGTGTWNPTDVTSPFWNWTIIYIK